MKNRLEDILHRIPACRKCRAKGEVEAIRRYLTPAAENSPLHPRQNRDKIKQK
nr:MAG TPA: hypothetical protein [Caudoviricetes sp.]